MLETLDLQDSFKPYRSGVTQKDILEAVNLWSAKEKAVKDLSSGMKQRLKLGLAIFADTPLLLLDEPTTNLDKAGIQLYMKAVQRLPGETTVIVCTNDSELEAPFCTDTLELPD